MDDKTAHRLNKHLDRQGTPEFIEAHSERIRARHVETINAAIAKNPRVVVTLGCSFAFGQGSYTDEMMAMVRPQGHGQFSDFDYVFKDHDINDLLDLAEHYKLRIHIPSNHDHGVLNPKEWMNHSTGEYELVTKPLEHSQCFGNQLADYMDYVPVNFAQNGNGNQSSINRLFNYPIDWHKCEDIVVIWSYTDPVRTDVQNDQQLDFHMVGDDHKTMWPQHQAYDPSTEKFHTGSVWHNTQATWTQTCWSDLYNYITFVNDGIRLRTWCKANHNANLIILPAFVRLNYPTLEDMYCRTRVIRNKDQLIENEIAGTFELATYEFEANQKAVQMFPWECVIEPGGYDTFFNLVLSQEGTAVAENTSMHSILGQGSPTDWILPCGHPSYKGHRLLADHLHKHIESL